SGRLVNLAAAEGHPPDVMDMSFATQALVTRWAVERSRDGGLAVKVHNVPREVELRVATLKLESMGLRIDRLTREQREYLTSWHVGTGARGLRGRRGGAPSRHARRSGHTNVAATESA